MAEQLPPQNPNNLLSKPLGIRTVEDEIQHHQEHILNIESDFYFGKLINEFGYSRLQARQRVNQMIEEKRRIIRDLQAKNKGDSFFDVMEQMSADNLRSE